MLTIRKGLEGYTGPHQGLGAKRRVHGGGWPCADLHCACQSPHWGHGRGGEEGGHQGGNSSSQRCCRPSCPVGCRLWTLTAASGHPTEQPTYINMSVVGRPTQHSFKVYMVIQNHKLLMWGSSLQQGWQHQVTTNKWKNETSNKILFTGFFWTLQSTNLLVQLFYYWGTWSSW